MDSEAISKSESVTDKTAVIQSEGRQLVEQCERAVIDSNESAEKMTDLLGIIKARKDRAEDARKALVKPLNDHVKFINNQFKESSASLLHADQIGRRKLGDYLTQKRESERAEQERARREAEDRAINEAAKLEAEGRNLEATQVVETASNIPQGTSSGPTRGMMGAKASTVSRWTFEIEDISKIPHGYMTPDEKIIAAAIREGIRSIPGIRIFEKTSVAIR